MLYPWKVRLLKTFLGGRIWRWWQGQLGHPVGNYSDLHRYIKNYAPGHSFVDIGCMWGVNGDYAFLAEEVGATMVNGVDVFGPTPEFELRKKDRNSAVEFILGDIGHPSTIAKVGMVDVVFCAGVLYHHPSPFDLLVAQRRICGKFMILRTSTVPEVSNLPNVAVYFPMLKDQDRALWDLSGTGLRNQVGIASAFQPEAGYGNWFWGLTPSCLESLLATAGFRVEHRATEAFAQTVVCTPTAVPFEHYLPENSEAIGIAAAISQSGEAQPA